jgi:hypothetical protein
LNSSTTIEITLSLTGNKFDNNITARFVIPRVGRGINDKERKPYSDENIQFGI